jgi:hypothetical protein
MANSIEWSHAGNAPAIADPDDLGYPLDEGEVAVWLGSDGAAVLYGDPDTIRDWAAALLAILPTTPSTTTNGA